MNALFRKIEKKDTNTLLDMMQEFYSSPAVFTNGSMEIFSADISACTSDSPYLEGYVFEIDEKIVGYSMLAKSFSTEFGKPCYWIEDIYLIKEYRGKKIAKNFFNFLFEKYQDGIFRLEVEKENETAVSFYEKNGFTYLPYLEMKK